MEKWFDSAEEAGWSTEPEEEDEIPVQAIVFSVSLQEEWKFPDKKAVYNDTQFS